MERSRKAKNRDRKRDARFFYAVDIMPAKTIPPPRNVCFYRLLYAAALSFIILLCSCELQLKPCDVSGTIDPGQPHGIVTSGFGLSWKLLNHRINRWEIRPDWNGNDYNDNEYALAVSSIGGPWSTGTYLEDFPQAEYSFFYVEGGSNCWLAQAAIPLIIEAGESKAEKKIELRLDDVNLDTFPNHAVFLQGLSFNTNISQSASYPSDYKPKDGYTSRGIGGGVKDVVSSTEKITFTTWARMESGPADRDNMNRAIKYARIEATVFVLVAGYIHGTVTYKEHEYSLFYEPPALLYQPEYDHAGPRKRLVTIEGESGFETAFLALRSFNFDLFSSVDNGDYMRELSVQAELLDYDKTGGEAKIDLDGYASNASTFTFETMENDFSASVALVQLGSGAAFSGYIKKEFNAGSEVIPLVP